MIFGVRTVLACLMICVHIGRHSGCVRCFYSTVFYWAFELVFGAFSFICIFNNDHTNECSKSSRALTKVLERSWEIVSLVVISRNFYQRTRRRLHNISSTHGENIKTSLYSRAMQSRTMWPFSLWRELILCQRGGRQ